jgi:ADP-ribose pyrophosphatase YjhB (NUDIX family)/GNAT superfamily N-acetyltransferase
VVALSPADLAEVEGFYRAAYPGTWFQPRMLETGRYVGIRRDGALVCVAGVHVWSPTWGVATLGNVATLPARRGAGLATAACARLCLTLLDDGIDVISLNVSADNVAAIRAYEKLGFAHAADYVEVLLGPGRERPIEGDADTRLGGYAVLIDEQDRILLALWNEGTTPAWTLPGGGAEPGETSEQAAVREVLEETGYHVELGRLLGEDSLSVAADERLDGSGRELRAVRHVYEARIVGGELRPEVGGTTDRAEWIPIDRVPAVERVELVDVALRLVRR